MTSDDRERDEERAAKKAFRRLRDQLGAQQTPGLAVRLQAICTEEWLQEPVTVETPRGPIRFVLLGKASARRAATLLTKQPATIAWIDGFAPHSVLWDIGANIGVYTVYAARRPDMRVVAVEPVAVNAFLLAANCEVNHVDDRVETLAVAVGQRCGVQYIEASQFKAAKSFAVGGKAHEPYPSRQAAITLTLDRLVSDFGVPCPTHLKIDVPTMTAAILAGGEHMLRGVREVHLEVDAGGDAAALTGWLREAGLTVAAVDQHRQSSDVTFVRR